MTNHFANLLRERGYRMTPQRDAILRILSEHHGHLTPQEVYERSQEGMPALTEATVYRTLAFLTQEGFLLAAHVGGGQLVYEVAGRDHHHIICRKCAEQHEVDHALLQALYERLEEASGYCVDSFHVTFFGLCPECRKKTTHSQT